MTPFTFNTSRSVRFGAGLILQLGEMTRSEIGRRVLLVTDPGMLATGLVAVSYTHLTLPTTD